MYIFFQHLPCCMFAPFPRMIPCIGMPCVQYNVLLESTYTIRNIRALSLTRALLMFVYHSFTSMMLTGSFSKSFRSSAWLGRCRLLYGCILLLLSTCMARAQSQAIFLGVDQGLSQGFVSSVVQCSRGYIWAGTLNGLNRYDGRNFKVYQMSDAAQHGLVSKAILGLYQDDAGRMWVSGGSALQVYCPNSDRFYTPPFLSKNRHISISNRLYFEGNALYAVHNDSLFHFWIIGNDPENIDIRLEASHALAKNTCSKSVALVTVGNELWVGTYSGVYAFGNQRKGVRILPEIGEEIVQMWKDSLRHLICVQTRKRMYVFRFDGTIQKMENLSSNYVGHIAGVLEGGHYPVYLQSRLYTWNGTEFQKSNLNVPDDVICGLVDKQKNIWLGLNSRGLMCIPNRTTKINHTYQKGRAARYLPVPETDGSVWIFQEGQEAEHMSSMRYRRHLIRGDEITNGASSLSLALLDIDQYGQKWGINHARKLVRIGPDLRMTEYPVQGVNTFHEVFGLRCLIGGSLFLLSSDLQMCYFIHPETQAQLSLNHPLSMGDNPNFELSSIGTAQKVNGWNWLTRSNGIIGLKPYWENDSIAVIRIPKHELTFGENQNFIHSVTVQSDLNDDNLIWICAWEGLFRYDLTEKKLTRVESHHLPPTNAVFTMVQSEPDMLFLGTLKGLVSLKPSTGSTHHFTFADGLPANEFNRNTNRLGLDGRIWMGTTNGMVSFLPSDLEPSKEFFPLVFSAVSFGDSLLHISNDGQTYHIGPISANNNALQIQFAMLEYANNQAHKYRYRLGNQQSWVYTAQNNSISLAGLSPGNYRLEVQGSTDGGNWGDSAYLEFTVQTPWWLTTWAFLLYLMLIAIPILIMWRNRELLSREQHKNELLHQKAMYETELFTAKQRFLTNVAHDLRTPLTLIEGVVTSIEESSPEDSKKVETIRRQSRKLVSMVNQIIDLERITSLKGVQLRPQSHALKPLLGALIDAHEGNAALKKVHLVLQVPDNLPIVLMDDQALRAILDNLVSNAIKFSDAGGEVKVMATVEDQILTIKVKDQGPGILEEDLERIFERYYQTEDAKMSGGSGIGLAYAAEMAGLMRGRLEAESNRTQGSNGSVFTLTMPLVLVPDGSATAATAPGEKDAGQEAAEAPANRILLVEDNPDLADYIAGLLTDKYQVRIAYNGEEGLAAAADYMPDLIITDIMMPVMDGVEMAQMLKQNLRTSHIPIIILSAKTDERAMDEGLGAGAVAYLTKPFHKTALLGHVQSSLLWRDRLRSHYAGAWVQQDRATPDGIEENNFIPSKKEHAFIVNVKSLIESNYADSGFGVEALATLLFISKSQLQRKMHALGADSVGNLIRTFRLERAKEMLLKDPDATISTIAFECGFSDPNYFSTAFTKEFKLTPTQFRKQDKTLD